MFPKQAVQESSSSSSSDETPTCLLMLKAYTSPLPCHEQVYKAIWQETTVVAVKMLLCKVNS